MQKIRTLLRYLVFFGFAFVGLLHATVIIVPLSYSAGPNVFVVSWLLLFSVMWLAGYGATAYAYGLISIQSKADVVKSFVCQIVHFSFLIILTNLVLGRLDPAAGGLIATGDDPWALFSPIIFLAEFGAIFAGSVAVLTGLPGLVIVFLGGIVWCFRWREWKPKLTSRGPSGTFEHNKDDSDDLVFRIDEPSK